MEANGASRDPSTEQKTSAGGAEIFPSSGADSVGITRGPPSPGGGAGNAATRRRGEETGDGDKGAGDEENGAGRRRLNYIRRGGG